MAATAPLIRVAPPVASTARRVLAVRVAIVLAVLAAWQALALSGCCSATSCRRCRRSAARSSTLLGRADFYANLGVTAMEIGIAVVIGGLAGLAVGIALGANRFLSNAFEALLLYLGPTPKIVFFR
jgi:ABC-type nitrate/sulfonate/bicarbonate transport system permease component